jgi:uncharacterized membrane protein (UPF0136 family)
MDFDQHLRALGIAHIIYSCLLLIPAAIVFGVLTTVGMFTDNYEASQILPLVGTSVGAFLFILAIPGILAGYGVLTKRSWGLPVALVVGLLNILCFPFGTALGGYSLWVFTKSNELAKGDGSSASGTSAVDSATYSS